MFLFLDQLKKLSALGQIGEFFSITSTDIPYLHLVSVSLSTEITELEKGNYTSELSS